MERFHSDEGVVWLGGFGKASAVPRRMAAGACTICGKPRQIGNSGRSGRPGVDAVGTGARTRVALGGPLRSGFFPAQSGYFGRDLSSDRTRHAHAGTAIAYALLQELRTRGTPPT